MPIWLCSQPKKKHLDSRWTPENHLDSGGVHLEYVGQGKVLAFASFPPFPFFPVLVPFATSSVVSGCASPSGSSWCFFWCLLAWSPAFEGPRLRTGVWVRTWPLHDALSSLRVWGGMVSVSWIVVDHGGVVDGGCGKKEVTWQHVTHSYHVWDVTDHELRR